MANSLPAHPAPSPVTGHGLWARVARYVRCTDSSLDPDEWFPVSVTPERARREAAAAIAVSNSCLVRGECLALSLRYWDIGQHGIWGGLIAADRARLRRPQAASGSRASHRIRCSRTLGSGSTSPGSPASNIVGFTRACQRRLAWSTGRHPRQ